MAQIFHRSANFLARLIIVGVLVLGGVLSVGMYFFVRSSYATGTQIPLNQPVPFSHKHHVAGVGMDCRYCHTSVEDSSFAGIPPTKTCMNCHSQVWSDSPMLEPVRTSFRENKPLEWNRVHNLADFVYFNHSIHVAKGMGCVSCHGQVDDMPLMFKQNTLLMEWCLDCHRNPEKHVRPREEVFNMRWEPPADREKMAQELIEKYQIKRKTNCSTCHR